MIGDIYPHRYFLCNKCEILTHNKENFLIKVCEIEFCKKQFFANAYHLKYLNKKTCCDDCDKIM